jgi:tripartite-type tricarboxylate transporter receptor subunit TctC
MKLPRRTFLQLAGGAAALGTGTAPRIAGAQAYPSRAVTMVVTFAAGGGDDILARIVAPRLSEVLGQQVIIENVGGAGGMTGAARVAKAAPDGYQLVLGGTGPFAANQTLYKNPLYNAATDFAPVVLIAEQPIALIARKDLPAGNLPEFIAFAKSNQAKMQFGSPGTGSTSHLACALLNAAIGINVAHIPYRGGAPAFQDLLAGRIDYVCPYSSTAMPYIESRNVKAIAVLSKHRAATLPDLPTAQEQGLAGFEAYQWFGIFLPRGAAPAIIQTLHDAAIAAMDTPAVRERLKELGATVVPPERRSPEYLKTFVESEIEKWAAAIKASGVSVD